MTTKFLESGTSATYGFDLFATTSGTIASSTECANMQARSVKVTMNVLGYAALGTHASFGSPQGGRLSFFMAGPDSNSNQISVPTTSVCTIAKLIFANGTDCYIEITTGGKMQLASHTGGTKTGSATVTGLNSPQHICVAGYGTAGTNFSIKLYINGVLDISATNTDFGMGSGAPAYTCVGVLGASGNANALYFSSIFYDDDQSLNSPGVISVTAKLPSKLNTNNFDTLGGSGTNRYDRVSERPLSQTNYIQHAAVSDVQENFGIQGEIEGDDNVCGAQIVARAAWAVAKRGAFAKDFTYTGGNNTKTAGTTSTYTSGGPAVGDAMIVVIGMDGSTGTVSCTDNASTPNTYTLDLDKAAASPSSSNVRLCIFRATITNITNLTTITITHPSVSARAWHIFKIPGGLQATPLDKSNSAVGTGANAAPGASGVTSQNNELIFTAAVVECPNDGTEYAQSPTGGVTTIGTANGTTGGGAASNVTLSSAWAYQTAAASWTVTWTSAANDWTAGIVTYKCVGEGSPKLMNNGTEGSALTLTTAAAAYMNIVDGGGYPANPAAVGMRSSNDEPDTYMYECGMLIAYLPGPPTHHHHKWNPTFNPVLAQ